MVTFSCILYLNKKKDKIKFDSVYSIFDVKERIAEYISNDKTKYKTFDISIFDKKPELGTAELDIEIELNENNIPTLLYVLYGSDLYETMVDIFINALPPLGEMSGSLSYPTVGKKHEPATFVLKRFEILADIKPVSNTNLLWKSLRGQKSLAYSTESDIVSYVKSAIGDIIQSCGINASCANDFGVSGLKPDIMVLANSIGLLIGIIEVKKPSKNIMENERLHGQTFNYMLSIAEMYGQEDVYGISTTYDCWRVYWLPRCDRSATSSELDFISQSKTTLEKPVTITSTSNLQDLITTIDDILPPTPNKRILYGSKVYEYSDTQLPKVLYSVLMKMYYSKRKEEIPLLDVKRMYIQVVESAWFWVNINIKKLHYFIDTPLQLVKSCILLYDLKGGAHGRVWLCCAPKGVLEGQVFVLKFSKSENSPEIELHNECEKWRELWGLNSFVRTWNSKPALMMPFVTPASEDDWRSKEFIDLVINTIDKLSNMKFHHKDLKKCHVGKYLDSNGVIKIVFFDLVLYETNEDIQFIKESINGNNNNNNSYTFNTSKFYQVINNLKNDNRFDGLLGAGSIITNHNGFKIDHGYGFIMV
ncbi:hypothetical protein ACTFIZ_011414 [Dictyostelium cf. discoideum]